MLTLTLIAGVITIVALLVIRLSPVAPTTGAALPAEIRLPEGTEPVAVTMGNGWYAIVTGGDEILIYDKATGELRQRVRIQR